MNNAEINTSAISHYQNSYYKDFNVFPQSILGWSGYWIRLDANAETRRFQLCRDY